MLELRNITYSYNRREALKEINIKIEEGERVVILGGNGCGKTTLLKLMDGLIFPDDGEYFWNEQEVKENSFKQRDFSREFRRKIVMLFQDVEVMLFNPTVWDEIAFGPRQLEIENIETRVENWGERLGISHLFKRHPGELSIGEKKRVALASILILEPQVILLDEPLSNLDPRTTGELIDLLLELGATIISSTQNLSLAPELGQRAVLISENHRKVYDGSFDELFEDEKLLLEANLLHIHKHRHEEKVHRHFHPHDWKYTKIP